MTALDVVILSSFSVGLMALFTEAIKKFVVSVPLRLWHYLVSRLVISVKFTNMDWGFDMVKQWLSVHPYAQKARQVKMAWSSKEGRYVMVPGYGTHYLWHNHAPLVIVYGAEKNEKKDSSWWSPPTPEESYTVKLLSRDHSRMEAFMQELSKFKKEDKTVLRVYTWKGYWHSPGPRRKRDMRTVYMPESLKKRLIDDIQKFIDNESWYVARGIPYRRGYLFHGPPGTGKTTLATALAGHFNRPIYCLNLNSIGSDESLIHAFADVPSDGIVLMEDVDAFDVSQRRADSDPPEATPESNPPNGYVQGSTLKAVENKKKEFGVTISGLLNAIDGVVATEGRILVMTTNHVEKLDPALVRSGRVDSKIEIGALDPESVGEMFLCFFPDSKKLIRIRNYSCHRVQSAANWQELFIRYHDCEDQLFSEVVDPHLKQIGL